MIGVQRRVSTLALAALFGVGLLGATASAASAAVVCSKDGDCWHTDRRYHYAPELQVQIHPDDWYFHRDWPHDTAHHWREYHKGRGYYSNGAWKPF